MESFGESRTPGPKCFFSDDIEVAIAKQYLSGKGTSVEIAAKFAPLSPTGLMSEALVRKIAKKRQPQIEREKIEGAVLARPPLATEPPKWSEAPSSVPADSIEPSEAA